MFTKFILVALFFGVTFSKRVGYGPGLQDWGFVDVREGAHMFWWLLYANVTEPTEKPLIIWLQGGPGLSASGSGYFEDIGPIDMNSVARAYSWTNDANILFIDSPVGVGFSYVDREIYFAMSEDQYVNDVINTIIGFYEQLQFNKSIPLHIFGEGYAANIAIKLARMDNSKSQLTNLKSISLISPWISPPESVQYWSQYLRVLGLINLEGTSDIQIEARKINEHINARNYTKATEAMHLTRLRVEHHTNGVNFMNVLKPTRFAFGKSMNPAEEQSIELRNFMRLNVSKALNISSNIIWGSQSTYVFNFLSADFMLNTRHFVNDVLQKQIRVSIINGQLDLMVPVEVTYNWVFQIIPNFRNVTRFGIGINDILEGYRQISGNFTMYWINRAGHYIQRDNPAAMKFVLDRVLN